jgi:uncharacterized protein (TIGR00369 family)
MSFTDDLGLRPVEVEGGVATVELDASERHLNQAGTVHGGVLATLVDTAMGAAVYSDGDGDGDADGRPATIELKVSYLEPGGVGRLLCTARVRKSGRRITIVEAEVEDADGETIALATGTFTTVAS